MEIQSSRKQIEECISILNIIAETLPGIICTAAEMLAESLDRGGKVLIIGNGGSAAQASHIAAELAGRFKLERKGLPAIALNADTSVVTALSNDYGYEYVFSRQLEALSIEGDVLIAISTSGNSRNILKAVEIAKSRNVKVIALTGSANVLKDMADIAITVPSDNVPRIQEAHVVIAHIICDMVERNLFGGKDETVH